MTKRRKWLVAAACAAVVLLSGRLILPTILERYVSGVLQRNDTYKGRLEDVDVALWRGAYRIENLVIEKIVDDVAEPFLGVSSVDLAVEWPALLKGKIVGEVSLNKPVLTIAPSEEDEEEPEPPPGDHWSDAVRELMPLTINRFVANEGVVVYAGGGTLVDPDIVVTQVQLEVLDISNAQFVLEDELPSPSTATGILNGEGDLEIRGRINAISRRFDMDLQLSCEGIDLPSLNPLLERAAGLDAKRGRLDIYGEWIAVGGEIEGYLKFIADDLEIRKNAQNPISLLWEAVAGLFVQTTENQRRDQFATRVPFSGQYGDTSAGLWPSFLSILRNGFVKAMDPGVEGEVDLDTLREKKGDD